MNDKLLLDKFILKLKDKYIFPNDFKWEGRQKIYILVCKEHNEKVEKLYDNYMIIL